eukprot:XP_011681792.1 PREDICTED: lysine-specific demethylase 8 [Strongylocentrotus purpuratus]
MTTSPVCFSLPTLIYQAIFLLVLSNSRGSVASLPEQHAAMHSTPDVVPQGDGVQGADLPGHLKPLGSHRPPEDPGIDVLHRVPDPLDFFNRYVKDGKPVIFKGAAQNMDSYKLWTDEYLSKSYGHLKVEVEEGKKENRSKDLWHMSLSNFIQKYQKEDVYLVTDVPPEMSDEFCLLRCLLCGGFPTSLVDTILWYSSGGTKSVLHFDGVDNINCIMDGSKEVFLVDKLSSFMARSARHSRQSYYLSSPSSVSSTACDAVRTTAHGPHSSVSATAVCPRSSISARHSTHISNPTSDTDV